MAKSLITRKVGMTSTISEDGTLQPVTLLSASPNVITQIKTVEKDGYNSLQLGFETKKHPTKPQMGHFKESKIQPKIVREFRINEVEEELKVGQTLDASVFEIGNIVKAVGTSKGKGWAGTIKRHNFKRGRKTHGGRSYREVGSIGSMYPQKIFKGKKMAGQMGNERVSIRNLTIVLIDIDKNLIGVKGSVPGPRRGIVLLESK